MADNDLHSPAASLGTLGIEVQRLDNFLVNQWSLDPDAELGALHEMVEDYMRSAIDLDGLLVRLQGRAPSFVAEDAPSARRVVSRPCRLRAA